MKKLFIPGVMMILCAFASCKKDHKPSPEKQSTLRVENVLSAQNFVESGTFKGTGNPPLILPGQQVSFSFSAAKGQTLTFATMYGWSSDLFFAPENPGISLYGADGKPVEGDVSSQLRLWDDGTRINQKPGAANPHTAAPDLHGVVTAINGMDTQGFSYLSANKLIKATLAYEGNGQFTMTITNISGGTANETPFSPGVWTISNLLGGMPFSANPLFTAGQKSANGLQPLAEMGDNSTLSGWLSQHTGIITPLSPVLVVVYHGEANPIFSLGQPDPGKGLTDIAQRGDASALQAYLQNEPGVRHVYLLAEPKNMLLLPSISGAPGGMVEQLINYQPGDKITFATMFGYSNDWFFSFGKEGLSATTTGDLSDQVSLWDDGTALSEYPGAGVDQGAFGGQPQSNPENKPISQVNSAFPVPPIKDMIRFSISK